MANSLHATRPTTFITPTGQLDIRMTSNNLNELCTAARTLKARYFVTVDGYVQAENLPIWGVFDMRTAQKDTPYMGQWSIDDPIKRFTAESSDAAVMYALAKGRL